MDEKSFSTRRSISSKDVIGFYDNYAEFWDSRFEKNVSTSKFHEIRLDSFLRLAQLKKDYVIVEMGVGTGKYLQRIAPLVNKVICVDGSHRMLDILIERNKNLKNIHIKKMDLEECIHDVNVKANLIYCFGLIEHIINVDIFIRNCKLFLKSNGRIILVTPNGNSPWYGKMRFLFRSGKHCSTDKYYTKEKLDSIMYRHGFVPESHLYWGYFPAGVGTCMYKLFNMLGQAIAKTRFRQKAGGLTASYILSNNKF